MNQVIEIILLTSIAGSCIPLGAFIASLEHIRPKWLEQELRHFVTALGGGILMGAVALILVPEGIKEVNAPLLSIFYFLLGGGVFFYIERMLGLRKREAPQFMGMLLDYIPETLALGGLIVTQSASAFLLTFLVCLQNLPEGFNAYRELISIKHNTRKKIFIIMLSLIFIGPIAGVIGYYFLSNHVDVLGAVMLFASGGILYLIFQDIAPQSRLKKHWAPPLGAVIGFSIALIGHLYGN